MKKERVGQIVVAIATLIIGVVTNYHFLPGADVDDGFSAQIRYVFGLFQADNVFGELQENWLLLVHVIRVFAVIPFVYLEIWIGPVASLTLLLFLLLPLARVLGSRNQNLFALAPVFLPLFVSGRSVLVAIGVGYIIFYLHENRSHLKLWLGVLFVNLSSASVFISLLLLIFWKSKCNFNNISMSWSRLAAIVVLLGSFAVSMLDKILGFQSGDVGYEGYGVDSDNIFLVILSRSTLFFSFFEGQYLRVAAYGSIGAILLFKLIVLIFDHRSPIARRMVLCCLPGIFVEGLGVLAMVFPLTWLLTGFGMSEVRLKRTVSTQ